MTQEEILNERIQRLADLKVTLDNFNGALIGIEDLKYFNKSEIEQAKKIRRNLYQELDVDKIIYSMLAGEQN